MIGSILGLQKNNNNKQKITYQKFNKCMSAYTCVLEETIGPVGLQCVKSVIFLTRWYNWIFTYKRIDNTYQLQNGGQTHQKQKKPKAPKFLHVIVIM